MWQLTAGSEGSESCPGGGCLGQKPEEEGIVKRVLGAGDERTGLCGLKGLRTEGKREVEEVGCMMPGDF